MDQVDSSASNCPSLRAFFDGLTPRLDAARKLDAALDVALARRFNAFDFLNSSELGLSSIVAELLDVNGGHGQRALFLRILVDKLAHSVSPLDIESSSAEVEHAIDGGRRIDVVVWLGDSCLAIENKPYAGDQCRQIHDYLAWLNKKCKKFQLVYLSAHGAPPSETSVTLDELRKNGTNGRFKIMGYAGHEQWEDEYDEFRIPYSLEDWFADCQRNCHVDRLRWFLREAESFCKQQFGGQTVTDEERKALTEFVLDRKNQLEIAQAIHECWPEVKQRVVEGFYEVLWEAEARDGYVDHEHWRIETGYSDQPQSRGKCYWSMFKETWSVQSGSRTSIRLENNHRGPNGWFIGVFSAAALGDDGRQLYEKLRKKLDTCVAPTETPEDRWPWWIWVKEEYRDWGSIIPALNEELRVRGDITNYFVDELVAKITNVATRIIDEIEFKS